MRANNQLQVILFWGGVAIACYCLGGLTALGVAAIIFATIQAQDILRGNDENT